MIRIPEYLEKRRALAESLAAAAEREGLNGAGEGANGHRTLPIDLATDEPIGR